MATSALKKIDALRATIDSHIPLDTHTLKQVKEYFRIGLAYSSNALEGNSLSAVESGINSIVNRAVDNPVE